MPTNVMKLFPDDMIHDIFLRLPPKSVLRFRCLSRSLCSKLDSREFTNQHLNHSRKSDTYETLIITDDKVQLVEHRLVPPKVRRLTLPFIPAGHCPDPKVRLCGSCHGLIALRISCSEFVVWNPYTGKHKRLAPESEHIHGHFVMCSYALGFGYDSITRDYKLVRIDKNYAHHQRFRVTVYSFRSNTWRQLGGLASTFSISSMRRYGALFREVLLFASSTCDPDGDSILAFDLRTEEFRALQGLPGYGTAKRFLDVKVLRGQLCAVFSLYETSEVEVWAMNDYGGKDESWTKLLRASLPRSLYSEFDCLLDYMEDGKKIMVHGCWSGPVWVDLERGTTEELLRFEPRTIWCAPDATLLVGTLVSIDGSHQ